MADAAPQQLFTCITCHVGFREAEDQRAHYRTEWHRYNLKRKVADMRPVSQGDFEARAHSQLVKEQEAEKRAMTAFGCDACSKTFSSENAFANHVNSKKHQEMLARPPKAPSALTSSSKKKAPEPTEEPQAAGVGGDDLGEERDEIDQALAEARKLTANECIFCLHETDDFDANMSHMTTAHSFFVPDIEFLTDLPGLIEYLGDKIALGNVCLACDKAFLSLEAVQRHMIDKGHCSIYYEDDMDEVISDFYDFRPSYPDFDPANPQAEIEPADSSLEVDDSMAMVLPSGGRAGHRSMQRFAKQKFRPQDDRGSVLVNQLMSQYRALGWYTQSPEEKREIRTYLREKQAERMRMGVRTNMLFKARAQMMQF